MQFSVRKEDYSDSRFFLHSTDKTDDNQEVTSLFSITNLQKQHVHAYILRLHNISYLL